MAEAEPGGRAPCVVLATCQRWPNLSPSDACYAAALRASGAQVTAAAWNDGGAQAAFHAADLVVIRGTWDFHEDVPAYRTWLSGLEAGAVRVLNDRALIERFLDKAEFAGLAGEEVVTPGCHVCRPDAAAIRRVLSAEGWSRAVLKPVNGASGRGVQLVTPRTTDDALAAVVCDVGRRYLLVQEFIPEITEGETQFVLFDGRVSHAVLKRPGANEFRTNSVFDPDLHVVHPPPKASERIEALVRRLGARPLYARVDVVMRGTTPVLLELEVNEPGLWLDIAPPHAAGTFARATLDRVG